MNEIDSAAQETLALFNNGLNCAQTVSSIFCEKYGVSKELAYQLANGLGSGVRSGEICGAVLGSLLVVGLKHGQRAWDDLETKENCNTRSDEFISAFRGANGSIVCRELLGCDISTREGLDYAQEHDLYRSVCLEKVKNAILLLEELGY